MVTVYLEGDVKFTVDLTVEEIENAMEFARNNKKFMVLSAEFKELGQQYYVWVNPDKIIFMR
jgi:hypothetical protein